MLCCVQLLISCRLYTHCCAHVADNPWSCDCGSMYTVYRTFRNGTRQNVTLLCKSPEELKGKSWDVLEEMCQRTVTPPQPAATGSTANTTAVSTANSTAISTANTTAVSTSQPDQFNITVHRNVSVQESSPDTSHSPSARLVIALCMFGVAVYCVVVALTVTIVKLRMACCNDSEGTQQVGTAEYFPLQPISSIVQFRAT